MLRDRGFDRPDPAHNLCYSTKKPASHCLQVKLYAQYSDTGNFEFCKPGLKIILRIELQSGPGSMRFKSPGSFEIMDPGTPGPQPLHKRMLAAGV